jgi:hypothetical protein
VRCGGEAPASNRARGRMGNRGEKAGNDDHLHAELLRRAGVMERWRSGAMVAYPSLAAKAAARDRFCKAKGGAAGLAGSRSRGGVLLGGRGLGVRARGSGRWGKALTWPNSDASLSRTRAGGRG